MHNLQIYYGKNTNLVRNPELSHTVKVVLTLTEHLHNKDYDLTDWFYTSPALAEELEKIGITLTGILMSNKRGLPKQIKKRNKKRKGSFESYQYKKNDGILLD